MNTTSIEVSTTIENNDLYINLHNDSFLMKIWVYTDGAAAIESDLKFSPDETECDGSLQHYNTAIDAIESLVLGHAAAGVDVCTNSYLVGLETAIEAIGNHIA